MPYKIAVAKSEYLVDRGAIESARRPAADAAVELEALFNSLKSLRALVEAEGQASLAVMLIPSKEELFAALPGDDGVVAAVRTRLAAEGIPYLDLYPILREREAEAAPISLATFTSAVSATRWSRRPSSTGGRRYLRSADDPSFSRAALHNYLQLDKIRRDAVKIGCGTQGVRPCHSAYQPGSCGRRLTHTCVCLAGQWSFAASSIPTTRSALSQSRNVARMHAN